MWQLRDRFGMWAVVFAALSLFVVAGLIGGPGNVQDVDAIHSLAAERATHIGLTGRAVRITHFGGAPMLVAILLIAIAWLAVARRWRPAVSLAAIVLGGRIAVELLKVAIQRPRPFFSPYPIEVASLSFPSGHAANTMITFLALALIVAPSRVRIMAIVAATATSLLVGVTRPLLGVHWPSDVIGGWAFGTAWVLLGCTLSRRWIDSAK